MDSSVEIYYQQDVPHRQTWVWMSPVLLVIEAALDDAEREAAIDEAFADLRARALQRARRPVGRSAAA